jgi:hypothetical protein
MSLQRLLKFVFFGRKWSGLGKAEKITLSGHKNNSGGIANEAARVWAGAQDLVNLAKQSQRNREARN